MNRTEYQKFLQDMWDEIENPNGNFVDAFGPSTSEEERQALRKMAGVALMVADRYQSNLSRLRAQRSVE